MNMLVYLLCYCMEAKEKPGMGAAILFRWWLTDVIVEHHGSCRATSYILQALSSEKAFNDKLSTPLKVQVPSKWATQGTVGDFMINVSFVPFQSAFHFLDSCLSQYIISSQLRQDNSTPYIRL